MRTILCTLAVLALAPGAWAACDSDSPLPTTARELRAERDHGNAPNFPW